MSDQIGGYVNTRLLCIHCIDHTHSNENFPLTESQVLAKHRCAICGRTLRKSLKEGPIKNGN